MNYNAVFPESFALLREHQFDALDAWLAKALQAAWHQDFSRHETLYQLANAGAALGVHLERWAMACPHSPHARPVLAAYWSCVAGALRGGALPEAVSESDWDLITLCDDRALRFGMAALADGCLPDFTAAALINAVCHGQVPPWMIEDSVPEPDMVLAEDAFFGRLGAQMPLSLPRLPAGVLEDPIRHFLEIAKTERPDPIESLRAAMHYLRPRWYGSIEAMWALRNGPDCAHLSPAQLEDLEVKIQTDHLDGFVPMDMESEEFDASIQTFDALIESLQTARGRAQALVVKGQFCAIQGEDAEAVACFRTAHAEAPNSVWSFDDVAEIALQQNPQDPFVHVAAQGECLAGKVSGTLCLALVFQLGLAGQAEDTSLAATLWQHAQDLSLTGESWCDLAKALNECDPDMAVTLLREGVRREVPGCHGALAWVYYDGLLADAPDRATIQALAREGAARGDKDAEYVLLQMALDEASADETALQRQIDALAAFACENQHEIALQEAIFLSEDNAEKTWELVCVAHEESYEWADAHMAFHYWFGVGVARNREAAEAHLALAFDDDRINPIARQVARARRFPPLNWLSYLRRPRKSWVTVRS